MNIYFFNLIACLLYLIFNSNEFVFLQKTKYINQKRYNKRSCNLMKLIIKNVSSFYFIIRPLSSTKFKSFILYGITSRCDSFKKRILIRKTLMKEMRLYNSLGFFFMGKSNNDYHNRLIKKENSIYNDLIQISFIESYFNLTLLSIWMIKWITKYCHFEYFIKNDQDVIPNLKLINNWLKVINNTKCSYGILSSKERTCRNSNLKSYIPYSSYNYTILPNYLFGFFAIYNKKLIIDINKISQSTFPIIYKEDVHIGLLAQKSNNTLCRIKYKIQNYIHNSYINIKNTIAIHGIKNEYYKYFKLFNHCCL